jgi:hypothetical protein
LHEQRGEQGLLKLQAIHQVKDPEKIQTCESRQRFSNWEIRLNENQNSKIQQNFFIFSIFSKKVAIILFVED